MINPALRIQQIKPSATLAVTARAATLKAQGNDVISLGAGEPDFDTPEFIKEAAIEAIRSGFTKYTAVEGIPELKQAIVEKFKRDNGLTYQSKQILVSVGGKQSIYNLAQALLNPGDEVIIPAPYWVSYPDIALLAEAIPITLFAGIEQGFKITPEQLEQSITPKTRLFFINSPSNPTGVVYSKAELTALGEVLKKYPQIFVATDDIYESILWGEEPFTNVLTCCPELYDRSIVLNGVSKAYSMTGWRIGYAAGPEWLIQAMATIQSQSTSNPTSISQIAAKAALNGPQTCIMEMRQAFKARHDYIVQALNELPGFHCLPTLGAFYAFPSVQEAIRRSGLGNDDIAFAEYLLTEAKVAVVPGSAFGAPGYVRFSYATGLERLQEAMKRLRDVLSK